MSPFRVRATSSLSSSDSRLTERPLSLSRKPPSATADVYSIPELVYAPRPRKFLGVYDGPRGVGSAPLLVSGGRPLTAPHQRPAGCLFRSWSLPLCPRKRMKRTATTTPQSTSAFA